jgi:hypothetical protein
MPGLVDETEAILHFVADRYKEIDRRPHREELERAFEIADALKLSGSTCAATAKRSPRRKAAAPLLNSRRFSKRPLGARKGLHRRPICVRRLLVPVILYDRYRRLRALSLVE